MSNNCVAEAYDGYHVILRISADYSDEDMDTAANLLATEAERVFSTDGSNILRGLGRWKGESENGRTIEIVKRIDSRLGVYAGLLEHCMQAISEYCNLTLGLSCFATVQQLRAYELYEED